MGFKKTWTAAAVAWSHFTGRKQHEHARDPRFRLRVLIVEPTTHLDRPVEVIFERPEQARSLADELIAWAEWREATPPLAAALAELDEPGEHTGGGE